VSRRGDYGVLMRKRSDTFITVAELAERFQISRGQAYLLIRRGTIPAVRLSEHGIRVDPDALAAWLGRRHTAHEVVSG
jgi:excisionase family DNA binding protein